MEINNCIESCLHNDHVKITPIEIITNPIDSKSIKYYSTWLDESNAGLNN